MEPPKDPVVYRTYVAAVHAAQAGRWRESASGYRKAYELPACAKWSGSYHVWSGYTSIIRENHFLASDEDLKALKRVGSDTSRPLLDRAQSFFTRGLARFNQGHRQEAARDYQEALRIVSLATPQQRRQKTINTVMDDSGAMSYHPTVGTELDTIKKGAADNLRILQGGATGQDMVDTVTLNAQRAQLPGAGPGGPIRRSAGRMGPLGDQAENEQILKDALARLAVGGDECDECGALPEPGTKLKRCGRCQLVFYCGRECSQKAWKNGHKRACRKPGQFEVGDLVQIQGLANKTDINGDIVEVRGLKENDDTRLRVAMIGGEKEIGIKRDNLRRLRPKLN